MDNRRVAGQTGILALTAVLLLALCGCSQPPDQDAEKPREPDSVVDPAVMMNQGLVDDFEMLESFAGAGQVILRVSSQGPTQAQSSICDRKIKVQTFGPTIFWEPSFSPIEVTWQVAQSPFGSWMTGDRIFIERKLSSDDSCFASEPFDINYPDLDVESDQPLENCRLEGPWPAFWLYKATLFNDECRSEENPDGQVATADPLVIIKPRP
ncbi:MAG: hypothetical protein WBC09_19215 [Thermoanaerobaculia bacterium]